MINIFLSILIVGCCYCLYNYLSHSKTIEKLFNKNFNETEKQLRFIILNRITGAFLFGLIPMICQFLLKIQPNTKSWLAISLNFKTLFYILPTGIILVGINFFAAKSKNNLKIYPQIRKKEWSKQLLIVSALAWITYLLGYEIMLRGFLLFNTFANLGFGLAIIINTIVYALIHIPKGAKEVAGAIPLGIVLCLITLHTGTIWAAFWLHCILALSNEWFSLKYHPEIKFKA